MTAMRKTLLLVLATFALASCGGGGSGSNSVFTGPGTDTVLTLTPTTTTLPASPYTVGDEETAPFPGNFLGSPYISEVTVSWRHKNGDLVGGTSPVNVSVTPTGTITYSTLNSGTGDQFHTLLGSGSVDVTAGVGTIFVHAGQTPGTGTLTVTAVDPVSGQTISAQVKFTIVGASSGLPSSITVSAAGGVYVSSSGGPQSTVVTATVKDGSNALVTAPDGVSNVLFQILGPAGNDATLVGVDGAGNAHTGTSVSVPSHNGIATVTFQAGSQQGAVQVQATADRGDNNVDNGISNPVSATTTVAVSDGKLDSLTLSFNGALAPSILVNRVSTAATLASQTTTTPPDPDATYSLTVTVQGTDRQGNPVLPGTQIRFGSIDSPVDPTGDFFEISGIHGDPEEGGINFTATDGQFKTAGGGAGPGDTLLVIGKEDEGAPAGNDDLESAAKVTAVISQTHLTVATPFNLNDTTGTSQNYGAVLPYIVGRAQIGNITSPAVTNANGRATTTLNYPVSELGHIVAIWAQGTGTDSLTNGTKLVTDIAVIAFPGVANAILSVSPNPLPGNITVPVEACITDALGSPIANETLQFAFGGLGAGSGTLDGISGGGTIPGVTDASGCITASVTTNGISGTSGTAQLTISGAGQSVIDPIVASGDLVLFAIPGQLGGSGGQVTLTLLNGNGTPVPGAQLTGTCTNAAISSVIPVTNAQGQATASISANLNIPNAPGTGSCTFTTSTGSPSATVTLQGTDPCLNTGVSPTNPACTGGTSGQSTLNLNVSGPGAVSVTSNPSGVQCSSATGAATPCTNTLNGGTYNITASQHGTWSGSCVPTGTSPTNKATIVVPNSTSTLTCTYVGQP